MRLCSSVGDESFAVPIQRCVFWWNDPAIYLHIFTWNIVCLGFVWGSCWQQRVVFTKNCYRRSEVYLFLFIYLFSFFFWFCFSPLRACRMIHPARGCVGRQVSFYHDSMNSPKPLQDGIWHVAKSIFLSYSVYFFFVFFCVRSFFFSISSLLLFLS